MEYVVYYMKPDSFSTFILGVVKPTIADLNTTHTQLLRIERPSLEEVFHYLQGEVWSPNGEARSLIQRLGLAHTSMSVGDVVHAVDTDEYFVCAVIGFDKLED
jgi:hypothetical protein